MPLYQQPADKQREAYLAEVLGKVWKCEAVEFPPLCKIDWYLKRGSALVALIEFKVRHNRTSAEMPTFFLNAQKFWALQFGGWSFGVKALVVAAFEDGLFYVDVATLPGVKTEVRGRTDRDARYVEPVLVIPVDRLTRICDVDWAAMQGAAAQPLVETH